MFNATPDRFRQLRVTARVEFGGRMVAAMLVVDEAAWSQSTDAQEDVRRELRYMLANEILKHLDVKFTVQS